MGAMDKGSIVQGAVPVKAENIADIQAGGWLCEDAPGILCSGSSLNIPYKVRDNRLHAGSYSKVQ